MKAQTEKEITELKVNIEKILLELGFKQFSINISPHYHWETFPISQSIDSEYYDGKDLISFGPPGSEKKILRIEIPDKKDRKFIYENLNIITNYSNKFDSDLILLEYISVLIIIENINDEKAADVTRILKRSVLNRTRLDVLEITTKIRY